MGVHTEGHKILIAIGSCALGTWFTKIFRHGGYVGHEDLVDERSEPKPEVGGDLLHLLGQLSSQRGQFFLVVLHGLGQVHQVVQIDGVVFGLRVLDVQSVDFVQSQLQLHPLWPNLNNVVAAGTHAARRRRGRRGVGRAGLRPMGTAGHLRFVATFRHGSTAMNRPTQFPVNEHDRFVARIYGVLLRAVVDFVPVASRLGTVGLGAPAAVVALDALPAGRFARAGQLG